MDSVKFNKYKTAADVVNLALSKAIDLCHQKMKAYFICTFCDSIITQKLKQTYKKSKKGIVLPTCLSINSYVAHNSYTEKDDYQLVDDDIVRIELACHVDNNVASVGETIKVGDKEWNESDQMTAALKAIQLGIQIIKPGVELIEYKKYIEKVVNQFGYHLVNRPNIFHDDEMTIFYDWCFRDNDYFCEPSWVVKQQHELELYDEQELSDDEFDKEQFFTIGEVYHIAVVLSTNPKITHESPRKPQIYQRTNNSYQLKSKYARELLNKVVNEHSDYCWKLENIDMSEARAKIGLKECLQHGVIRRLGIVEQKDSEIVLMKCSIAIQNNSVYKLTGQKYKYVKSHDKLDDELNKILTSSKKFDKRDNYDKI